jgi:GT2 family glycosyltransferase
MDGVSILIPSWNRRDLLETLVPALERQTEPPAEIVVVDNGSTDGSAEAARRLGAQVVEMGSNRGFAAAVNRGLEQCRREWVAVVNNDVTPRPDWLEKLRAGTAEGWFGAGKLLSAADAAVLDGTWDLVARSGCAWHCGSGRKDGPLWSRRRAIRMAPFTASLFRRELFQRVGALDESFESYLEDVDFGLRCAVEGLSGVYVPEAVAVHQGSATWGQWNPATVRRISRNQVLLVAKHFPAGWFRYYGWSVTVGQTLWGLLALRHGAGAAFAAGKWEGWRRFEALRRLHPDGARAEALRIILTENEAEIRDLQRKTGFDIYWRIYCALT